jgi:hypothetical protein
MSGVYKGLTVWTESLWPFRLEIPTLGQSMPCTSCGSENVRRFKGQIPVRYPGLEKTDGPPLWVFPELVLCLDCDNALFLVPGAELRLNGKLIHYQKPSRTPAPTVGVLQRALKRLP